MNVKQELEQAIRTVPDFPKPGIMFRDITPVLENPVLTRAVITEMAKQLEGMEIDAVIGIESRGFLFGLPLAMELNLPFIVVRKRGKLPAETVVYAYDLEYGRAEIEMHRGVLREDMRILIHDDLLATGGTAAAAAELAKLEGGIPIGFSFLIELEELGGRERLARYNVPEISLLKF